jgi:hypothetical protein
MERSVRIAESAAATAERHADIAEGSVRKVERGYLFVIEVDTTVDVIFDRQAVSVPLHVDCVVKVKNYGRTPINITSALIRPQFSAGIPPLATETALRSGEEVTPIEITIGPSDEFTFDGIRDTEAISTDLRNDIVQQRRAFFCAWFHKIL